MAALLVILFEIEEQTVFGMKKEVEQLMSDQSSIDQYCLDLKQDLEKKDTESVGHHLQSEEDMPASLEQGHYHFLDSRVVEVDLGSLASFLVIDTYFLQRSPVVIF